MAALIEAITFRSFRIAGPPETLDTVISYILFDLPPAFNISVALSR